MTATAEHGSATRRRVERRIYSRRTAGGEERFEVSFFSAGRQHWQTAESLEAARLLRDASPAETERRRQGEAAATEARRRAERARVRERADLSDAYSFIRRAAQCLDRVSGSSSLRDAQSALIRCEDALNIAIRERA